MAASRALALLVRQRDRIIFMVIGALLYQFFISGSPSKDSTDIIVKDANMKVTLDNDYPSYNEIVRVAPASHQTDTETDEDKNDVIDRSVPVTSSAKQTGLKTILFWNTFFRQESYGMGGFGQAPFIRGKCAVNTCQTTNNRSLLTSADSVLVHGGYGLKDQIPVRTRRDQIYVFFDFEPPLMLRFSLKPLNDLFNLTFSYLNHTDTDVYSPYGIVTHVTKPRKYYQPLSRAVVQRKTKQVAWMVSDCTPKSKRAAYATELGKHITVDIFGKCGTKSCPASDPKKCNAILEEYKFYLAFENSYCDQYVTEKTFKMLRQQNMIPIVLGGADYSKITPKHSVINVEDFKSPRHLAAYLHELDANDTKFMEYFPWKKYTHINLAPRIEGFCKLCEILHQDNYPYKTGFKVDEYWSSKKSCISGKAEEKRLHLYN